MHLVDRQASSSFASETSSLSDVITPTDSSSISLSVPGSSQSLSTDTGLSSSLDISTALPPTLSLSSLSVDSTQITPTPITTTPTGLTSSLPPETTPSPTQTTSQQLSSSSPSSSSPTSPSSTQLTSSSIPPRSTQPPPSTSTSPQAIPTTITTSITAYINGTDAIVTQTTIPTLLPELGHTSSSSNRTAIIAGSAVGGTALLIILLSLAFFARRNHFKYLNFLDALSLKRRQARSRAMLLAGEDFDDNTDMDLGRAPVGRYSDHDHDGPRDDRHPRGGPTPTDSGSIFREDVWPPPGDSERSRLMGDDPLVKDDLDLGRIVDDIMGPSVASAHFSHDSIAQSFRGSVFESEVGGATHSRSGSNASNAALLDAMAMNGTTTNASMRPSPLAQSGMKAESEEHGGTS